MNAKKFTYGFTQHGSWMLSAVPNSTRSRMTTLNKGFTLIELLVVIAIIALFTSIVFAALSTARMKARDTARIAQAQALAVSIEQYASTKGGYNIAGAGDSGSSKGFVSKNYPGFPSIASVLKQSEVLGASSINDPLYKEENFYYYPCLDGTANIFIRVEGQQHADSDAALSQKCGGNEAKLLGLNKAIGIGGAGLASGAEMMAPAVALSAPRLTLLDSLDSGYSGVISILHNTMGYPKIFYTSDQYLGSTFMASCSDTACSSAATSTLTPTTFMGQAYQVSLAENWYTHTTPTRVNS